LRHDKSAATHFELVVGRFLQVLGARELRYEVKGSEGPSVDWTAAFEDGEVAVEATAPVVNPAIGEATKAAAPVLEMVGSIAPAGWHVVVVHAPPLAPGERLASVKRHLSEVFSTLPPRTAPGTVREVTLELKRGVLQVDIVAASDPELRATDVSGPVVGYMDNTSEVVSRAVAGKRRQARGAGVPVLAALFTGGFGSSELEKFDIALFGRTTVRLESGQRWIDPSGVFGRGTGKPTFAGALAFAELGWHGGPDPLLYLHPRFVGRLPAALMSLRRRVLTATEIVDVPSTTEGLLERLDWPTS